MFSARMFLNICLLSVLISQINCRTYPSGTDVAKSISDAFNSLGTATKDTIDDNFAVIKRKSELIFDILKMTLGLVMKVFSRFSNGVAIAINILSTGVGAFAGFTLTGFGILLNQVELGLSLASKIFSFIAGLAQPFGKELLEANSRG